MRLHRAHSASGHSSPSMPAYDALLLVSFGGPEGPEDVLPFLENVAARQERARASGCSRSPSTTSCSAASARSMPRTAPCWRPWSPSSTRTGRTCRSTGAIATGIRCWPTPFGRWPTTASQPRVGLRHLGLRLLLGLPAVPRRHRAGPAGGRPRAPRGSTSCGCSTTIRASSSRWPSGCGTPWTPYPAAIARPHG